jgi:tripartite-type tricarboxylate transporter receptor subunit TctC
MRLMLKRLLLAGLFGCVAAAPVAAQSVEEFYEGRSVDVLIGYTAGGGYDSYARVLARYMGKYIPGNPTLVPKNMPGAGSLKLANFLANVAPKDGSVFGIIGRGIPMEPLLGGEGTEFDPLTMTWIGSVTNEVSICASWKTSEVKTWPDLLQKELIVGGTGSGADTDTFPLVLRNVLGAKLKLISGYPGGTDVLLAMERGEVGGRCGWSWSSVKSIHPEWVKDGTINILAQLSLNKHPDLPDMPLIMDLTQNDEQKQILRLIFSRQVMGRPFVAPPGLPADRATALQTAFMETMKDPEFLAEAQKQDLEVNPVSGAEIQALLVDLYETPKEIADKAAAAIKEE